MKHNWEYRRLGDIAPAKPFKGTITSSNDKYWCLNLDKVESNTGVVLEYDYIEESELGGSVHKFAVDNVLFSKLRPNLNKVVVPEQNGYCTTELVPLHPLDILNRYYLAYYLRSPKYVNFLIGKTGGAKMPRVKMDIFWNSTIPLPPMETQEQIVAELDQINDLIAKNRELLSQLDALAQSLFYDTFGDPIANPKGWNTARIKDCCSHLYAGGDKPKDTTVERTVDNQIPIFSNGVENKGLYGYTSIPRSTAPSITISGRGTIGVPFIRSTPFFPIIRLIVATPDPSIIDIQYLYFVFISLNLGGKGAAIPQLTVPMVKDINIPLPPLSLQEDFATKVEAIEAQKAKVEAEISELQTLLDARMDYWFN